MSECGPHQAIYHEPLVPEYVGNPFIEALPALLERAQAKDLMRFHPAYFDDMRSFPAAQREHLASMVSALREPTWLHGELYARISRLICSGYVSRNPVDAHFQSIIAQRQHALRLNLSSEEVAQYQAIRQNGGYRLSPNIIPNANGLTFLGTSGIGKSTALQMVLGLWPSLILHTNYRGRSFNRVQIPALSFDVPPDGSVLALAHNFILTLDNLYASYGLKSDFRGAYLASRPTEATLAPKLSLIAQQIGLGLLVLDELQDLSPGKARRFLSFIVQLVNTVGVPVILVGGLDSYRLVTEQFRQVRRGSSEGDLIVTQSEQGSRWEDFCRILWRYQFTAELTEFSSEHSNALFEVSQGITDLLVIAYKNAQIRAVSTDNPSVTPNIIRSVRDTLVLAQPALKAIERKSDFVLDRLTDLKVPAGVRSQPFLRTDALPPKDQKKAATPRTTAIAANAPRLNGAGERRHRKSTRDEGNLLCRTVSEGRLHGLTPREALSAAGFGAGELWRDIVG